MLGDKKEAKFEGVMSAQNTYHIPAFYHVFISFHIVISVVIAFHLILGVLCISGENNGNWRLCGGLKKEIGEPSSKVAILRSGVSAAQRCDISKS